MSVGGGVLCCPRLNRGATSWLRTIERKTRKKRKSKRLICSLYTFLVMRKANVKGETIVEAHITTWGHFKQAQEFLAL